ncbi:MAG: DUF2141 domain-containing protein [Desulfobacterales bacterium]|nr:DUF2141 domain-containing protein [Desulfobacterales bacterium]MDJ0857077.1 DUF2141 domain-containing protein [Desulfobacterales bacterium]MDJ0887499.1 DUF2141 domain-containing protein [Desulfobacterales bacterium]MDJ0989551.1 DUF2141 domain-containing protein [Desulfobacterales bacterium]
MQVCKIACPMALLVFMAMPLQAQPGTVEATVTQIMTDRGGIVKIGVFESDGFPTPGKGVRERNLPVEADTAVIRFTDLPPGRYAIAVFQDADRDDQLTKNFMGVPKEPYGFSKNVFGMMGPPDFEDVAFEVRDGQELALTIRLE